MHIENSALAYFLGHPVYPFDNDCANV